MGSTMATGNPRPLEALRGQVLARTTIHLENPRSSRGALPLAWTPTMPLSKPLTPRSPARFSPISSNSHEVSETCAFHVDRVLLIHGLFCSLPSPAPGTLSCLEDSEVLPVTARLSVP